MEPIVYITSFGLGLGVWLVASLPLVVAFIVSLLPGQIIVKRWLFILLTGVVSYGIAVLIFVLFIPFSLLSTYFSPQWNAQGYNSLVDITDLIAEVGTILPFIAVVIGSFVVPIIGRRRYWSNMVEFMANKPIQSTPKSGATDS